MANLKLTKSNTKIGFNQTQKKGFQSTSQRPCSCKKVHLKKMKLLQIENKILRENVNFEQKVISNRGGNTFYKSLLKEQ